MKVVFRVDSSFRMGSGHFMRCLTLAEALHAQDVQVSFISRDHPGNIVHMLHKQAIPVTVLPAPTISESSHCEDYAEWLGVTQAEDAAETLEALYGRYPDWLVVDHYGLGIEWEQQVRSNVKKLMVIDDLASRSHDCDLLLDQNYSTEGEQRYAKLVPVTCKLLLGPRYALLQHEFRSIRGHLKSRKHKLKRILVFFTTGDDQGETLKAMHGIESFGPVEHVDVVVGLSNLSNAEIINKCQQLKWVYHCQIDYMPKLIAESDLVIGGGGSSNWERCALGVPSLVTILAENQAPITEALGRAGIIDNLGWNSTLKPSDYEKALKNITSNTLEEMSEKAIKLVDAKGAERVAAILLDKQ